MSKTDFRQTLDVVLKEISENYSFLYFKQKEFLNFREFMEENTTEKTDFKEFFKNASFAMGKFSDIHLDFLGLPYDLCKMKKSEKKNIDSEITRRYMSDMLNKGKIFVGKIEDKTYVRIDSYSTHISEDHDWLMNTLPEDCSKFIIDLRNNSGGLGRFSKSLTLHLLGGGGVVTFYHRRRLDQQDPSRLSDFEPEYLESGSASKNKVVILTSKNTCSAAELAALRFKAIPGAKIVGESTYGALSGSSKFYAFDESFSRLTVYDHKQLSVGLRIPTGLIYNPSRLLVQNAGLLPDYEICQDFLVEPDRDSALEKALDLLY